MKSQKGAVLLALGLIAAFLFYRNHKKTVPASISKIEKPADTPIQKSASVPRAAVPKPTVEDQGSEPAVLPSAQKRQGLCQAPVEAGEILLSMTDFKRLRGSHPDYLIVPHHHSSCWGQGGEKLARIVSYDRVEDLPYEYWGSVKLRLDLKVKLATLDLLPTLPPDVVRRSGYKAVSEIAQELFARGVVNTDGVSVFSVQVLDMPRTRTSAGSYEFYPGVKMRDWSSVQANASPWTLLDARAQVPKPDQDKLPKAIKIVYPRLKWTEVVAPQENLPILAKTDLSQIPKETEIVLIGTYGGDRTPLNLVPKLQKAGFKNITVVRGGYGAVINQSFETPVSIPSVDILSESTLENEFARLLFLDTRSNIARALRFPSTWRAPVAIPGGALRNNEFFQIVGSEIRYNFAAHLPRTLRIPDIAAMAQQTKVVLIGEDEFDWGPVLLADSLKRSGVSQLYWFRGGWSKLVLSKTMTLAGPNVESQLVPDVQTVQREVASKDKKAILVNTQSATLRSFEIRGQAH